jgi:hypothetical protein
MHFLLMAWRMWSLYSVSTHILSSMSGVTVVITLWVWAQNIGRSGTWEAYAQSLTYAHKRKSSGVTFSKCGDPIQQSEKVLLRDPETWKLQCVSLHPAGRWCSTVDAPILGRSVYITSAHLHIFSLHHSEGLHLWIPDIYLCLLPRVCHLLLVIAASHNRQSSDFEIMQWNSLSFSF